ncbi:hypothetical protein C8R44DRAFT_808251 [Mycena epipterygia]|nr:hypothetical protein C8R44DRAFT_808251 [Mycena epipterygia]
MERVLYCNFMGAFPGPGPSERPSLDSLQGIFQVANEMDYFTHKILTNRKSAHFPMRQIWAGRNFVHTLVYGPTEEYRRSTTGTTNHTGPPCIFSLRGEVCDLFVTGQDRYIYYAGMYVVHSLRHIHPPGSVIPPDVAPAGIQRAIAAALADKGNNAEVPIPNHELKTECFGLQCIGFDTKLYQVLLDKFNRTVRIPKRKTSKGDTGNEPVAKAPKT